MTSNDIFTLLKALLRTFTGLKTSELSKNMEWISSQLDLTLSATVDTIPNPKVLTNYDTLKLSPCSLHYLLQQTGASLGVRVLTEPTDLGETNLRLFIKLGNSKIIDLIFDITEIGSISKI